MPCFLFWNLMGNKIEARERRRDALIASLANLRESRGIDVFVFAEYFLDDGRLGDALSKADGGRFARHESRSSRLVFFSNLHASRRREIYAEPGVGDRLAIHRLEFPGSYPILLAGVHRHDKRNMRDEHSRVHHATRLAQKIRRIEADTGIARTIVVGDFNSNPYDREMTAADTFHAMSDRTQAGRVRSHENRKEWPSFYNPCWGLLGDRTPGPSGSYHLNSADDLSNPFWHLPDQVLLEPGLGGRLDRIEVLAHDGREDLVTATGRPKSSRFSDHLPLYFRVDLEGLRDDRS